MSPSRLIALLVGATVMIYAVGLAFVTQAGATSSAAEGGNAPTLFSVHLLEGLVGVVLAGSAAVAWGLTPEKSRRPYSMRERSALQERPSAGLVSFVARLFAAAGVGIAAMGALIPLPILCYSHGPSACGLAPPLLTIPHLLDAIGVGLGSAGAVMIVALRLRRPRGPTYGSD